MVTTGRFGKLAMAAVVEIVIPFSLIPLGEQTISSGLAGVLIATEPIFVLLLGLLMGIRARPSALAVFGLAVGFGGVVLLLGVAGAGPGIFLLIIAAASYGLGAILVGRWFSDLNPMIVVAYMLLIASPVLVVLAAVSGPSATPSWLGLSMVALLGVLCTAGGFVAFFALIKNAGADHAALTAYVAPVVSVVCGALVLSEPVEPRMVLGIALVFVGAWFATRLPRTRTAAETKIVGMEA